MKFAASEAIGLGRNDGSQAVSCDTEKSGQLKVTLTELKERVLGNEERATTASCDAGMFASESKEQVIYEVITVNLYEFSTTGTRGQLREASR